MVFVISDNNGFLRKQVRKSNVESAQDKSVGWDKQAVSALKGMR